jgi:hypothetical protein
VAGDDPPRDPIVTDQPAPLTAILRRLVMARVAELGGQRAAGLELGVDHSTISRWANSNREMSGGTVDALVEYFGRDRIARELQR